MPQKPTMPSPYMATVDATEPITFSCTIDNRDTIVDYEFNIEEIGSIKDTSTSTNEEFVLPPIFVGEATVNGKYKDSVRIYKESADSTEYTMVVEQKGSNTGSFKEKQKRINGDKSKFTLTNEQVILTENIVKIVQSKNDTTVRNYKFSDFPNLKEVCFLGDITEIGENIFSGSNSIKSFAFPDSLGKFSVSPSALSGNQSIEEITIPHMVMFFSHSSSTAINYVKPIPNVKKVVVKDINPFDSSYSATYDCDFGKYLGKYVIYNTHLKENVGIGLQRPFKDNTKLEEVVFLCPVESISDESFSGCVNLKKIVGLGDVKVIDNNVFNGCVNLSNFFDEFMQVESVGENAFINSGLEKIIIRENLKTIGASAFSGCANLSNIVAITTPTNLVVDESAFENINRESIILYGKSDILSTELYRMLYNSISTINIKDLYSSDGYTPVPLRGGAALMRTIDENFLENDKEYYWNAKITDSFGKTIITPNYYFRTRSNPSISIQKISTEISEIKDATEVNGDNENFNCDDDGTISTIYTDHDILTDESFYVDFVPNVSMLSETASFNSYYAEGNKIMNFVGTSVIFTGESIDIEFNEECRYHNNDGIGTVELYRLPIREVSEPYYPVEAILPVTEIITTENGEEEFLYNKPFTIWLKRGTNKVLQPGVESTEPEDLTIVRISTPNEKEYFSGTINLESDAEYQISYNTGFASDGVYEVTYFYESDVQSYTYTFTGEYGKNDEFSDIVPLKSYHWTLYEVVGDKQYLIDDTGVVYGSYPNYTYSMFVPNHDYCLCIEVENDEGVTATSEYKFSVANFETEMPYVPEISLNKRENAVCIKLEDASVFYSIIRFDIARNAYKLIAENIHGGSALPRYICDYTAASNTEYRYIVYALDADNNFSTWSSEIIVPNWCKTSIIGFQGSYIDNSPIVAEKENIWGFGLNVEDITYRQNMSKTLSQGVGSRYAHIASGKTNYKTFDISCLIGDVDNVDYTSDTAILTERWAEFLASPMAKLVVDMKGNVLICDATDASIKSEHNYFEMPTTISASFVEIAPSDKVSIYRIKDGE